MSASFAADPHSPGAPLDDLRSARAAGEVGRGGSTGLPPSPAVLGALVAHAGGGPGGRGGGPGGGPPEGLPGPGGGSNDLRLSIISCPCLRSCISALGSLGSLGSLGYPSKSLGSLAYALGSRPHPSLPAGNCRCEDPCGGGGPYPSRSSSWWWYLRSGGPYPRWSRSCPYPPSLSKDRRRPWYPSRGSRSKPSWYLSSLRPWWYPLSYLSSLRPWWYPSSYLSSLRPWWYPSSYLSFLRPYSSLRPSSTGDPPPAAPLRSGNESLRSGERAWEGGGMEAGRPPAHAASPILGLWTSAFSSLAGAFHVCEPFGTSSTLGSSPPCSLLWLGRLMGLGAEMRPRDTMRPTRWPPPGLCDWAKRREVRSAEKSGIAGWQGSSRHVGGEKVRVTPGPSGHERATAAAPGPAPGDAGSGKARFDRTNDPRSVPPTGWAGQIVLNASCRAVDAP